MESGCCELTSYADAPELRLDDKPVQVTAPPIPTDDQRPDDGAVDLGDEQRLGIAVQQPCELLRRRYPVLPNRRSAFGHLR